MDVRLLLISVLLGLSRAQLDGNECTKASAQSCGECIQAGEKCGWCTDESFLKPGEQKSTRCDVIDALIKKGCSEASIENPRGSTKINTNQPVTNRTKDGAKLKPDQITQIQPQKLTLNLRSGEAQTFSLKFKRAEDYPIDLYYLMGLSYSMKDDLENVKNLGTQLMKKMQTITSDFRIGFGSFVKKTVKPYISTTLAKLLNPCTSDQNCTSPFSYKNVLSLTEDGSQFNNLVSKQQISGNLDSPEGGFDAIMQVAVCANQIGWRNVTRLLVFSTDAGFHFAGDGKLGGIVLPNDGECHLQDNMYTMSHYYDYPSIAHLVQKLSENNIQTIFAVTKEFQPVYQELKNLIPKSAVGTLSSDSNNVIDLIIDAYNSLSSEVILENSRLPEGVSISYISHCKNGVIEKGENGRKCSNISIGDEVSFEVAITAKGCPLNGKSETVKIKPLGFTEEVEIVLNFICECECHKDGIPNSPSCHFGNGTLECGACRCNEGRIGRNCECSKDELRTEDLDANCRMKNGADICSNNGDCVFGMCECKIRDNPEERYSGMFCECDNFSCDRSNNKLCGGHGRCECRKCICDANYTGSACNCSLDTSTCLATNKQICNGRGNCECGVCKCTDSKFQGPTCEICPTCPGVSTENNFDFDSTFCNLFPAVAEPFLDMEAVPAYIWFACDFGWADNPSFCGWSQDGGEGVEWHINNNSKHADHKLPNLDHTGMPHNFIYAASNRNAQIEIERKANMETDEELERKGRVARLASLPVTAPDSDLCMSFWYHFTEKHTGTLNIIQKIEREEEEEDSELLIRSVSGQLKSRWREGRVVIPSADTPYQVIIEAQVDPTESGFISLDDIKILAEVNPEECKDPENTEGDEDEVNEIENCEGSDNTLWSFGRGSMLKSLDPILITIIVMSAVGVLLGAVCGVLFYCACAHTTNRNLSALESYNFELVDGVKLKKEKLSAQKSYTEA